MKTTISCSRTKLSDEEIDPLERDDVDALSNLLDVGWVPWNLDDLIDIERIIDEKMTSKQKQIIQAFLLGLNYKDLKVSEKYWRYHFTSAIEFIKKELKL